MTALWEHETRGDGPALLLLHGFGWTRSSFADLSPDLEPGHRLILADLPGHGASGDPTHGFEASLAALADEIQEEGASPLAVLGYSMGARLALGLALGWPGLVSRLVLIGGSPGLRVEAERRARIREDQERARDLELMGVPQFLDRWEAAPLFAGLRALPPERQTLLRTRRSTGATGMAAALRQFGLGVQPSYWDRLADLAMPTLLVTGARDAKFTALAAAMAARIPGARRLAVEGCVHAPHLEAPERLAGPLHSFLSGSSATAP